MDDHVYRVVEVVGSSTVGIDDAVRAAVERASASLHGLRWFELVETRGHIEDEQVKHVQVTLKIGYTLDDETGGTATGA